ncbi:MAG: fatty-acid synthase [Chloroflexi bacterium]|nr:fatty-acid synthase [Chloroflexota bacterium]
MPAKDKYHDTVARALGKIGWQVIGEQVRLFYGGRRFWVDLQAAQSNGAIAILIEVKGFENAPSPVDYLYSVIGQYILYLAIIEQSSHPMSLYLAVPVEAYEGVLGEELGQLVIDKVQIRLIVFDPRMEEIIKWIT